MDYHVDVNMLVGVSAEQIYSFTVLRYVHDVVAREFLNVGIVMYMPESRDLRVRTHKSVSRLSRTFSGIDAPAFRKAMQGIERGIVRLAEETSLVLPPGTQPDARRHALRVLPEDDSSLQWSPSGGGLTTDVDATLDRLYKRFVTQHDARPTERQSDRALWGRVTTRLGERNLNVPFQQKVLSGQIDSIQFENAWKNGSWHAYEPVSLDLASDNAVKQKARRWRGHLAAVQEGCDEDLHVHFLLGTPKDQSLAPTYEDAKRILQGSPFASRVMDETQTDDFVDLIEQEYRASPGEPSHP